jgi:subtilase family serine protease
MSMQGSKNRSVLRSPALAAVLISTAVIVVGQAAWASPLEVGAHPTPANWSAGDVRVRMTGAPLLGTANWDKVTAAESAASPLPSKSEQIKVLKAALKFMTDNYSQYSEYTPGPQDIFDYGIGNLWKQGIDGAGTTIAVIEGWKDPAIASVVASFDQTFKLPNPQIQTIFPSGDGKLPAKCPPGMVALGSYGSCQAWKGELDLDVIAAHLMAPYAKILISVTPADSEITDDAASQVAPPEMMEALEYISSHKLANVISISDGTGETTYSNGNPEILAQDPGELAAAAAGIPVVDATGDCGVVQNLAVANGQCEDVSSGPEIATWNDSPWVTAVGGSVPNVSTSTGARLGPDPLWHVAAPDAQFSEGAGLSMLYARPSYQDAVASITGSSMRSVPDITMDAQSGTSEAAPTFAGVLALASQENDGNVGPINPVLYGVLGPAGSADGISDVVSGNNSADTPGGTVTVPGFAATKGFDVASGWGTIYAPDFVPSLVNATKAANEDSATRRTARQQLSALESSIALSSSSVPKTKTKTINLSAEHFLPGHPIKVLIDDKSVKTLTASSLGAVSYVISPSALHLSEGSHKVELESMLLDETSSFTVT